MVVTGLQPRPATRAYAKDKPVAVVDIGSNSVRLVIYESTRSEPSREIWRVRLKGRDDSIDLLNPRLNEQQIVEVSQQLNQVLSEEL